MIQNSVDRIVERVLKKQTKRHSQIDDIYVEEIPQNSRITNYELQDKNVELRKQLKKLQKILSTKAKVKQRLIATHSQIDQLKQKLKSVLNASQSLEMSIIKIRGITKSKQKSQSNYESHCCCSRYKKYKLTNKTQKIYKQQIIENQSQNYMKQGHRSQKVYQRNDKQKSQTYQKSIQCDLNYLEDKKANIQQKKQHIQKLKKLIQSQSKVMKQYEQKYHINANVGKITKAINLKSSAYIKTCASVGSITKTSRYKALK